MTAVHRYVARTPSLIMAVQIEDVLGVLDQVNLPGTVSGHPNWCQRIELPVDQWANEPRLAGLAAEIARERG